MARKAPGSTGWRASVSSSTSPRARSAMRLRAVGLPLRKWPRMSCTRESRTDHAAAIASVRSVEPSE